MDKVGASSAKTCGQTEMNRAASSFKAKAALLPQTSLLLGPTRLQRKCACGGTPGSTGECEECRNKRQSKSPAQNGDHVLSKVAADLQPKLTIKLNAEIDATNYSLRFG
jgi:hypothetical protein